MNIQILGIIFLMLPLWFTHGQGADKQRIVLRAAQGNEEDQRVLEIINYAEKLRLPYNLRPLLTRYGGFGTSIQFDWGGKGNDTDIAFLVAVPLYAKTAVNVALGMLSHIAQEIPSWRIRIAFLADEKDGQRGLIDQLDQIDDPESVSVLYFDDSAAAGQPLSIYQGSEGHISPRQLIAQALSNGKRLAIPVEIPQPYSELFRLGWIPSPRALQTIQDRSFPALYITLPAEGSGIDSDVLSQFLILMYTQLPEDTSLFDYHYSLVAFNKNYFIIDEKTTVLFIIGSFFGIILFFSLYSILYRRKILSHWLVFLRRSWVFLLYFGLLVLSLYAARLAVKFWLIVHYTEESNFPAMDFMFLLLWVSFFSIVSPVTEKITIPKRSSFYGHGALILVLVGLFTAIAIDITLMPIFLWALMWIFIGSFVHSFSISLMSTVMAPGLILILFTSAVTKGQTIHTALIYPSSLVYSLLFALIMLPFVLLWKRTVFLKIQKARKAGSKNRIFVGRYIFGAAILLAFFTMKMPETELQAKSVIDSKKPQFTVSHSSTIFLNQRSISIQITANSPVDRYDIRLEQNGDGQIQLIESTIPFDNPGSKTMTASLGIHPDNPLRFELLLPQDEKIKVRVRGFLGTAEAEKVQEIP
ncbi:hypothetical protein [Gracilinema caldarium]|uniref:hypothetical protein n=1 Tax=Gracilinema caldarium TaxID=215591 RepID=UPI0026ED82AB|nr:hypothetical protein [Gracilinema caldarium]